MLRTVKELKAEVDYNEYLKVIEHHEEQMSDNKEEQVYTAFEDFIDTITPENFYDIKNKAVDLYEESVRRKIFEGLNTINYQLNELVANRIIDYFSVSYNADKMFACVTVTFDDRSYNGCMVLFLEDDGTFMCEGEKYHICEVYHVIETASKKNEMEED